MKQADVNLSVVYGVKAVEPIWRNSDEARTCCSYTVRQFGFDLGTSYGGDERMAAVNFDGHLSHVGKRERDETHQNRLQKYR
jgi:hypothetical protein